MKLVTQKVLARQGLKHETSQLYIEEAFVYWYLHKLIYTTHTHAQIYHHVWFHITSRFPQPSTNLQ